MGIDCFDLTESVRFGSAGEQRGFSSTDLHLEEVHLDRVPPVCTCCIAGLGFGVKCLGCGLSDLWFGV